MRRKVVPTLCVLAVLLVCVAQWVIRRECAEIERMCDSILLLASEGRFEDLRAARLLPEACVRGLEEQERRHGRIQSYRIKVLQQILGTPVEVHYEVVRQGCADHEWFSSYSPGTIHAYSTPTARYDEFRPDPPAKGGVGGWGRTRT